MFNAKFAQFDFDSKLHMEKISSIILLKSTAHPALI